MGDKIQRENTRAMGLALNAPGWGMMAPTFTKGGGFFNGEGNTMHESLLFPEGAKAEKASSETLKDLRLSGFFEKAASAATCCNVREWYEKPLQDLRSIKYRQEIAKDIEKLFDVLKGFSGDFERVRRILKMAEKLEWKIARQGWILESAILYCDAVSNLLENLKSGGVESEGLKAFLEYLEGYVMSKRFKELCERAREVKEELSRIEFCLLIELGKFSVRACEGEKDLSIEIEDLFEKFHEKESCEEYDFKLGERRGISHIEAKMLEFVGKIHPKPFEDLEAFCLSLFPFVDEGIDRFYREVQFYLSYFEAIKPLKEIGLPFTYPEVASGEDFFAKSLYDMVLALESFGKEIVLNDFELHDGERAIVVTGPNQGGKTTFARAIGQIHYVASLGLPISAKAARLPACDGIFTHFEREEDVKTLRSKLEDDLVRAKEILEKVTERSLVIMNEVFSSAALEDALSLSRKVMERLLEKGTMTLWVTFIDELSEIDERVVSMVAQVDPRDPTIRTFEVKRMKANGIAHAISIARKYGLTYEEVREKVKG